MELEFKLQTFEGPLDLLLHLIEKNKVSIYDIPIAEITEQYLEYIVSMDRENLDQASDFLVMASTLLDIKAKMLLPAPEKGEEEEGDPRQELVERLLEYRKFRYISEELRDCRILGDQLIFREPQIPREVLDYREPVNLDVLLDGLTLDRLRHIYRDVIRRREDRVDPVRSQFGSIPKEQVQIADMIGRVHRTVKEGKHCSFRGLLRRGATRLEVIVTFLALLELIHSGDITVSDDSIRDDIIIDSIEPENDSAGESPEDDSPEQEFAEDDGAEQEFAEDDGAEQEFAEDDRPEQETAEDDRAEQETTDEVRNP